jgi:hypothetical protein
MNMKKQLGIGVTLLLAILVLTTIQATRADFIPPEPPLCTSWEEFAKNPHLCPPPAKELDDEEWLCHDPAYGYYYGYCAPELLDIWSQPEYNPYPGPVQNNQLDIMKILPHWLTRGNQ